MPHEVSSWFQSLQKDSMPAIGMHRSKSKHELKLLEKIPENAEATVVLVGELLENLVEQLKQNRCYKTCPFSSMSVNQSIIQDLNNMCIREWLKSAVWSHPERCWNL